MIEIFVGISVGLISAVKRYSLTDKVTTFVTAAASALPVFVLGFLLQYAFAVVPEQARLAAVGPPADLAASGPTAGRSSSSPPGTSGATSILPAITLASVERGDSRRA